MRTPKRRRLHHGGDHREHRGAAYPPPGDGLDAAAKGFRALIDAGLPIPAETVAWVEACEAVKARFAKPAPPKG